MIGVNMSGPWGEFFFDGKDHIGLLKHFVKQLEYFLDTNQSPDRKHTRSDIEGYQEIIAMNDQEIARKFLDCKRIGKIKGNKRVIKSMRVKGIIK